MVPLKCSMEQERAAMVFRPQKQTRPENCTDCPGITIEGFAYREAVGLRTVAAPAAWGIRTLTTSAKTASAASRRAGRADPVVARGDIS